MRMMWDDGYLYIGAELEEPHVWATLRERDSIIFHDNDFEVFIDPSGDTHMYNEIEINAFNTVWDLLLVRTYDDGGPAIHGWDIAGLLHAVHVDGTINDPSDEDEGWTLEIAIPWGALAETAGVASPPSVGDRWRMNFSRVQWRLDDVNGAYTKRVDSGTGELLPEDNWVWSEQRLIAMHEPEYWGIVEFREEDVDSEVVPTEIDRAAWCLRQLYRVMRDRNASALTDIRQLDVLLQIYAPPEGWSWPPRYARVGDRWVLETSQREGTGAVRVHEDGRVVRRGGTAD
jgi:hypothetical protein